MKKILFAVAMMTGAVLFAGCSTLQSHQARVEFNTSPQGAMLYSEGRALGMAPQSLIYTANDPSAKTIRISEVEAVWPSGAKTKYKTSLGAGNEWTVTISRPKDSPGLDKDMQHALRINALKAREQAEVDAAWASAANSIGKSMSQQYSQPYAPTKSYDSSREIRSLYAPPIETRCDRINSTTTRCRTQ